MLRKALALAMTATLALACEAVETIWIPRTSSADPLYRFVKNGKAGYIDPTGRVVVPATLDAYGNSGAEFHDGLLEIAVANGKDIDRTGKVVLNPGLLRGWDFSEGLAVAMRKGEKLWGFIDTSGKFAISPRFETYPNGYVYSFSDGLAMFETYGKFGYVDRSGEFVIKPEFLDGTSFRNGAARVVASGPCAYLPDGPCSSPRLVGGDGTAATPSCKFTYIDGTGRVISQMQFDFGRDFSEGLAPVRIGKLWGFIDTSGSLVISAMFEDAEPFASGLARIREHDLYGFADKSGNVVIPARYKYAESFIDGLAVVTDEDRFMYIDRRGRRAFPGEFAAASPFFKGLANVPFLPREEKKTGAGSAYIDTKGRRIFTY